MRTVAVLSKFLLWKKEWKIGSKFKQFWDFTVVFEFPEILSPATCQATLV